MQSKAPGSRLVAARAKHSTLTVPSSTVPGLAIMGNGTTAATQGVGLGLILGNKQ